MKRTQLIITLVIAVASCVTGTEFHVAPTGQDTEGGTANRLSAKFGDQGDGTFRNPILASDYSDPCTIRVGEDYYMATSTFQLSPGVTILQSRDLVNWKTIGAAISDISTLGEELNWDRMNRYGKGVYAPTLRYHDGKFWIFVNCVSGEGFYVCTAKDPAGPWEVRQIQDKNGKPLRTHQWTDPCPFWDDNGKAYLASSRPGANWFGYLFEMTPDGSRLLDADVEHMDSGDRVYEYPGGGTRFSPFQSTEGNKIFKRNGFYYLLHIEFFDTGQGRGTYVFRSKNIYGTKPDGTPGKPGDPGKYEVFKLGPVGEAFYQKNLEIPGQGGFVDTPDGRWFWIAQFDRYGSEGRPPNLIPVTWVNDWPVPGVEVQDGHGKMAWQQVKPIPGQPATLPQGSDNFNASKLDPQWMWNYQPRAGKWSLTERPGFLRLHAFRQLEPGNFFKTGNVLCQRHVRTDKTEVTVKFDLAGMADGQEAGLAHFNGGKNYALIAVAKSGGRLAMRHRQDGSGTAGPELPAGTGPLWLRTTSGFDDQCRFAFSTDGKSFTILGGAFKLTNKNFRGDLVGLYTCNNSAETGSVDVDQFDYETRR